MIKLRIHHVFDIIRDIGTGKEIRPHQLGHSYHVVYFQIYLKKAPFIITNINDDICNNCTMLKENKCIDTISHRRDYQSKEMFNNYIDGRIMAVMEINHKEKMNLLDLVNIADRFILNIEYIYSGNDKWHTINRKENILKGIEIIKESYQ